MGYIRKGAYAPFRAFLDTVLPKRGEKLLIENVTDCTGADTGSLQTKGGAYVAKSLLVSGIANLNGGIAVSDKFTVSSAGAVVGVSGTFSGGISATTGTYSGKIETTNTSTTSVKSAGGGQFGGKLQVDSTASDAVYSKGGIKADGGINWAGGNVIYVPIGASIQDAIGGAKTGDTIILGAGTYTITSTITVNKKLHITGQGKGITTVTSATNQTSMFVITTESDSLISNMTIETTAIDTSPSERCILFEIDGTVQDVMFKLSGSGSNVFGQAIRNVTNGAVVNAINCDMVATGEYENGNHLVTCESGGIVNIYNCYAYSSNSTNERIITCHAGTVNIYNSFLEAVVTSGSTSSLGVVHCHGIVRLYNTTIKATGEGTVELKRLSNTLTVYNCTLGNNTTSGTINHKGTQRVNSLQSSGTIKVGAYTLPATDGTNGQVLKTNGSGVLTWSDI